MLLSQIGVLGKYLAQSLVLSCFTEHAMLCWVVVYRAVLCCAVCHCINHLLEGNVSSA